VIDFIEFLIVSSRTPIKFDSIQKLFHLFVSNAISEVETTLFFSLLTKEQETGPSRRYILNDKIRSEVY